MLYRVVKMNVPDGRGGRQDKWYAKEVAAGRSTFEMIADKIEDRCTVTRPDILAVLAAFVDDIKDRLQSGQIVELGELGNMQLVVTNRGGAATEEEWTQDYIKKAKVVFRPGTALKEAAAQTSFNRWSMPSSPDDGEEAAGQ